MTESPSPLTMLLFRHTRRREFMTILSDTAGATHRPGLPSAAGPYQRVWRAIMPVTVPTSDQLKEIANQVGLSLTEADVASFIGLMTPSIAGYNVVDALPDNLPQVKYPRTPGYRPNGEENPQNAWYVKTTVKGASGGKLAEKTVVLKDNVMLAGVPMMNGASTLEGYVPEVDATVAIRILDAGGTIVGKSHCEYFCLSGGSHTNATGTDNALLLEVIAGPDGYDPRQYAPRVHPYTKSLEGNVSGLRIGMVKEGFGHSSSEKDVDTKV